MLNENIIIHRLKTVNLQIGDRIGIDGKIEGPGKILNLYYILHFSIIYETIRKQFML